MKYCKHCKVKIENDIPYCPLCDIKTETLDDHYENDYPYVHSTYTRSVFFKIITFLAITIGCANLLLNYLIKTDSLWVVIVMGAILYLWISLVNFMTSAKNLGFLILVQLITISGFLFIIDGVTNYHRWSVNYVIPFLIIGASAIISVILLIRPMKFREYMVYQLVIAILGTASLLLLLFRLSDVTWPLLTAAFYSNMSFTAVFIFADRKTKNELKKRFHI